MQAEFLKKAQDNLHLAKSTDILLDYGYQILIMPRPVGNFANQQHGS